MDGFVGSWLTGLLGLLGLIELIALMRLIASKLRLIGFWELIGFWFWVEGSLLRVSCRAAVMPRLTLYPGPYWTTFVVVTMLVIVVMARALSSLCW